MPAPNPTERTLVIIKPDAVHRQLVGEILRRLERKGLRIVALKMLQIDRELAEKHYAVHKGKSFYDSLLSFVTSGPSVALVLEGEQAIGMVRQMMGATNPLNAEPGTIRGDYAVQTTYNLIHGSDSVEAAHYEIELFFAPHEIVSYPLCRSLYGVAW
jgi:nucleoside-diphosphate kinase